jgi:hypothetical protein
LTDLRGLSASRRTSERWFFRRQQGYDRMRERQYITYRYISYIFLLNTYLMSVMQRSRWLVKVAWLSSLSL